MPRRRWRSLPCSWLLPPLPSWHQLPPAAGRSRPWWGRRVRRRRRLPWPHQQQHQLIHCSLLASSSSPWVTSSPTSPRSSATCCPRTSGPRRWTASRGWCPSASCSPPAAASCTRWRSAASTRPDLCMLACRAFNLLGCLAHSMGQRNQMPLLFIYQYR
ncbi:hypothetical protein GQ55_2G083700 [Panicum hallii var. hallii]|uniref:Uncharacterized protein n=1 Tax=Panicum hallii var. hallii TaxID=1504633 RepID=A0A2T7EMS2_9POAL|nr:hypothetical protein GQ55_2G083700 [Panicum hallii var. hallii]